MDDYGMSEMDTEEGRTALYREHAAMLADMVAAREQHEREVPGCGAHPLCMGASGLVAYSTVAAGSPGFSTATVLTAVGELSRLGRERADLARRLEVQRGMTEDALKAADEWEKRAKVAEDSEQALAGELDTEKNEHARTLAELTQWQEAAEHLAPTTPVEE